MHRNYRCRKQIFNKDSNFENFIWQIPDSNCYSCEKTYQKQTRRVSVTSSITVLPQDHPDVFVSCNRCTNTILKNKTPPNAYWNNMRVAPIPAELKDLNKMEVRLISRVRPFVKVVRLGGDSASKDLKVRPFFLHSK